MEPKYEIRDFLDIKHYKWRFEKKMQLREAGLETKWNPLVTGQLETRIGLKRKLIVMD